MQYIEEQQNCKKTECQTKYSQVNRLQFEIKTCCNEIAKQLNSPMYNRTNTTANLNRLATQKFSI